MASGVSPQAQRAQRNAEAALAYLDEVLGKRSHNAVHLAAGATSSALDRLVQSDAQVDTVAYQARLDAMILGSRTFGAEFLNQPDESTDAVSFGATPAETRGRLRDLLSPGGRQWVAGTARAAQTPPKPRTTEL